MVHIIQLLAGLVLGFVTGGLTTWLLIDADDARTAELLAREQALRERIEDLHALLHVPPLFWQVWERYTHEHANQLLADLPPTGRHTTTSTQVDEPDIDGGQQHSDGRG